MTFGRLPARTLRMALLIAPLAACGDAAPQQQTLDERAMALAAAFESAEPYSGRFLNPADIAAFFARSPEYRPDSASVVAFYERRSMQFAWIIGDSLSASADAFVALALAADTADRYARPLGFTINELHEQDFVAGRRLPLCDSCAIDLELRLTAEFFRVASRRYGGNLSRDLRELSWFIPRAKKDLSRLIDSLAIGGTDLSAYEPVHPQYQLLKQAIALYATLPGEWPELSLPRGQRSLNVGDSAAVIQAIRDRLHVLGDAGGADPSDRYDDALAEAVRRFQARHGLQADGVIGASVLRALNVPPAQRLRTMLVNSERLRWMPETQPPDAIQVNIPEFRLHVYEAGRVVMSMDVVVGARATRTVVFSDSVAQIVFSPTWTVPTSITRNEILPAIRRDPDYLRKHNMEIIGGTESSPVIRQRPGPGNALGRVKFVFPNSYGIYMHDTPVTSVFDRESRALSHGCVRLSRPRELAEYLLRDDPDWPPDRIGQAMFGGRETPVRLAKKRLVVITYFTAWVDTDGLLNFRDDVYGHDARLAGELFASGSARDAIQGARED